MNASLVLSLNIIAFIISLVIALYAWSKRHVSGANGFCAWMLCATFGTIAYIFWMLSPDNEIAFYFNVIYMASIAIGSMFVIVFVLQFTDKGGWLRGKRMMLLFVIPAITIILLATNDYHSLVYEDLVYTRIDGMLFLDIAKTRLGTWFLVHTIYSYSIILIAFILLMHFVVKSLKPFRSQSLAIFIGLLIPVSASVISTVNLVDIILSSLAFAFGGVAFAYALFWYQWLDLSPIARGIIIENMNDSMIVLDLQNRIVDINPAAQFNLNLPSNQIVGKPAKEVLQSWPELISHLDDKNDYKSEIILKGNDKPEYLDLLISPMKGRNRKFIGKIISLRNITGRKIVEEKLKQSLADKDTLLNELNHRTKNNLQVISSMLELKSSSINDEDVKHFFKSMTSRIYAMSMIHQKLYQSKDISHLRLDGYIYDLGNMLLDYMKDKDKDVAIEFSIDEIQTTIDIAVFLGLILSELFSNTFKYAFVNVKKALITISLSITNEDAIEMVYKDNGVGLPRQFSIDTTDTLGIKIIHSLAKQLKGTAEFISHGGAVCKIQVPNKI